MTNHSRHKLLILTNAPTPYRIPFFNSLHVALERYNAELHVLYCTFREPHRQWDLHVEEQDFPWKVLPGWHPSVGDWYPHVNPSVVRVIRQLRPTWLLSAGAWNTPTVLLAARRVIAGSAFRMFWSESHARAVRHSRGPIAIARRRALRAYDGFAVPNAEGAAFIKAEIGQAAKVFLLPNTVENELFVQLSVTDRISLRGKLGIPPSNILLVTVARLVEPKGIRELIDGYQQLPSEVRMRTTLALVGEGALRTEAESSARSLSQGEIRIVGHLEKFGVRDWLCAADAFVLPTKRDNNPLSVIEAAFARLPLIVSRQAGNINELVQDGVNGFVLEAVDAASISKVLQQLLSLDCGERQEMGRRSLAIANQNFRRDDVAQRFAQQLVAVGKFWPQHTTDLSLNASVDS